MSMMTALIQHLLGNAGVSALVSTRVYPERLPDSTTETPNTMPLVTCELVDEPLVTTHGGQTLFKAQVQVDAWGGSYKSSQDTANAVFAALQGYVGWMGDQTVQVGGVFRQSKRDNSNPDVHLFRVTQTFLINWKEA